MVEKPKIALSFSTKIFQTVCIIGTPSLKMSKDKLKYFRGPFTSLPASKIKKKVKKNDYVAVLSMKDYVWKE